MNIWTFDRCKDEALKYYTKKDFTKNSGSAYNAAYKNCWLNDICKHMIIFTKPKSYWTFDKCKDEALKYYTKKDFRNYSNSAYQIAKKGKFLDEICTHMILLGNSHNKTIYVYEFSDNHAYIGITYNIIKRNYEHLSDIKSPVYKYINKTNLIPIKKILTNYLVENIKAKSLEIYWIDYYKSNNWILLNKAKGGALGGNKIYWTFEKCKEEALKYNTRYLFQKNSGSAYNASLKNEWLNDICKHMIKTQKPTSYWTFDRCKIEALKYNRRFLFQKNSISAYNAAYKKKWLNDICKHMI
jgi:hypothetical protein